MRISIPLEMAAHNRGPFFTLDTERDAIEHHTFEVCHELTERKKSYVPHVLARGGVGRRSRNPHWASRRCLKLSRSRQRRSECPKMIKYGKTHHRLSKIVKSKKITCWSTVVGLVGHNSGNCCSLEGGEGSLMRGQRWGQIGKNGDFDQYPWNWRNKNQKRNFFFSESLT